MVLEICDGLSHLLKVMLFCPLFISGSLAFSELRFYVNQELITPTRCGCFLIFRSFGLMFLFAGNDRSQLISRVTRTKRIHTNSALLRAAKEGRICRTFYLVSSRYHEIKKVAEGLRIFRQSIVDCEAETVTMG